MPKRSSTIAKDGDPKVGLARIAMGAAGPPDAAGRALAPGGSAVTLPELLDALG